MERTIILMRQYTDKKINMEEYEKALLDTEKKYIKLKQAEYGKDTTCRQSSRPKKPPSKPNTPNKSKRRVKTRRAKRGGYTTAPAALPATASPNGSAKTDGQPDWGILVSAIDRLNKKLDEPFIGEVSIENPFFTKNGKHTLEIALSLLNPENAKIYRHCNRLNSRERIASNRSVIPVADGDVLLNGTEIITEITEKEVKIQLVSGESELNYFIGGDKKPNSLELGSFNIHSTEEAGVFIPVFSSNEETVYNEARIIDSNGDEDYIDIQAVLEGGEESGSGSDAPDGMSIFFYTGRD